MSYATEVAKSTRRHFTALEIDVERCALAYGSTACGAILGVTGQAKCYNTKATCQRKANYTQTGNGYTNRITTFRFTDQEVVPYGSTPVIQRAMLKSVSFTPGRIDLGGSTIGQRSGCNFELFDGTGDDVQADDYLDERRSNFDNGFFLAKMIARWRYFQNRTVRVYQGFLTDEGMVDESSLKVRTYVLDSVTGPDGGGKVTGVAKDPLRITAKERSKFPIATKCALTVAATNVATTLTVDDTTDFDASGFLRIEDEIIQYSGKTATTFTGCTRGVAGTTAAAHDVDNNCQRTVQFNATDAVEVIYSVLAGAGVHTQFMDKTAWHTACDDWIELGAITAYVSAPEDVDKLLAGICEAWLLILYYDDETSKIILEPVRPPTAGEIINLTDDDNILVGKLTTSEKTDQRINEVWLNYGVIDWSQEAKEGNLLFTRITISADAQSAPEYDDVVPRSINSRWLGAVSDAQVTAVSTRYLLRFRDAPRRYKFSVDASTQLKLGSFVTVALAHIQDASGNRLTRNMRVIEVAPMAGGTQLSVTAEDDFFQGRYAFFTTDTADDYTGDAALDAGDGFFCSDYDVMPDGTDPYLFA
jgi:hypothetical protein